MPTEPFLLAADKISAGDTAWMLTSTAANTKPTNYTGHPALAMPCGKVVTTLRTSEVDAP